jgi:serine/threonine protein kinase
LTAALEHPGVVPVHALGVDPQGHPYYTMRRVRGRTLRDAMTACTTPAERRQLLGHFVALCQTLAYAHARGVVHRDVKPENVMVGPFGETLLLDWGLAGPARVAAEAPLGAPPLVDARQTRVGAVMGTPAYMSPEQARGEASQVGPATDVWSLGVLMVELLIGASPIDLSGTTEQIVARVARGELRDPAALAEVAPELRAITSKALAVDPAARYPDAGALAADVLAWQQGALVGAYDYTWSDRLYRWVRRNGAPLSVLGVAGVLGIVAGAFAFQQVRQERDVATAA